MNHEEDSFNLFNKQEDIINSRLKQADAKNALEEVYSCIYVIDNIVFQQGVRIGAKLLKELLEK